MPTQVKYNILDQAIIISVSSNNFRGVYAAIHHGFYSDNHEHWCYQAILQSAALGHMKILEYLLAHNFIKTYASSHNNEALSLAIKNKQYNTAYLLMGIDAVKDLETTYQHVQKNYSSNWEAFQSACLNHNGVFDIQEEEEQREHEDWVIFNVPSSPITTAYDTQQTQTAHVPTEEQAESIPKNKASGWCSIS